jgi:hypothetical protein
MNQRKEDFQRAENHIIFEWWKDRKLKNLGLNLCAYIGFTDYEKDVFRRVMLSLPDGDLVRDFMYLKYSFDSTLTSIEKTLYDDKLHDDYTKILEDLYEHEEKINELRKGRTILTSHLGSREYYTKVLKLQEFCRSIAG